MKNLYRSNLKNTDWTDDNNRDTRKTVINEQGVSERQFQLRKSGRSLKQGVI